MNRRSFVVATGASLLASAHMPAIVPLLSASQLDRSYASEMPNMLEAYLTGRLNRLAASWEIKRTLLQTATEVQDRNMAVRQTFLSMLGEFPPKSPLNAVTVRTIERDGYRVENVMFESRPDFWVTGNLYVPAGGGVRFPAIISPCGHYPLARMTPQYQSAYISLARSGFVVLGYDPIGQGERRQYWNAETGATEVGGPVFEHSMAGQLLLLFGENLTAYLVWEGIRAIDFLLTRPEVDPQRIGCAGHSGGGTLSKFIAVADPRVRCAAILEGGTANQWPAHGIGIADIEQNLFPAALNGVDNIDLHVAIAPTPLLVGIESYNAGFNKSADAIHMRYKQLGAGDKFETVAADDPHAWTPKLRRATTDWFCRWFYARPGPEEATVVETSPPETLYCTSNGSLLYSQKGMSIFSIIAHKASVLSTGNIEFQRAADLSVHCEQVRDRLRSLLRYQKGESPIAARHIVTTPREGYRVDKVEFLSEPGIYIPVWIFIPEHLAQPQRTILYFNGEGIQEDGMEYEGGESPGLTHGVLDQLVRSGSLVIAADVRGTGATRIPQDSPLSSGEFGQLFNKDTSASYACWSMDCSLPGMRVGDVVQCVDYAMGFRGVDAQRLHLIGKGRAALWCLYAAALDLRIGSLICTEGLIDYRTVAMIDRYRYGADVFVPEILRHFDLPEVAAAIAPRSLVLIEPRDGMMSPVDVDRARRTFHSTQAAFRVAGAEEKFSIERRDPDLQDAEQYLRLIVKMERNSLDQEETGRKRY